MRFAIVVLACLIAAPSPARADDESQLSGRVLDQTTGAPVEGALVFVSGPNGLDRVVSADAKGRYAIAVKPGTYHVIFVHGRSRTSGRVDVGAGAKAALDGRVDATSGEVIIIREHLVPPVKPKPKNYKPNRAPPYSDAAILADAWTKAHMLLDVDEQGVVRRVKFLQRPGHDLEKIAEREAFGLAFEPARDASGKPVRVWIVWSIEWPSAWWLAMFVGTRSAMPPVVGFPPHRLDHYVPCRGSGPLNLGSVHPVYKDCSKPDLSKAANEAWIVPKP